MIIKKAVCVVFMSFMLSRTEEDFLQKTPLKAVFPSDPFPMSNLGSVP